MSAVPVTTTESQTRKPPRLTLVPSPKASLSTFGFIVFVGVLIAVGLAAVLIVTTSVGTQSNELSDLRREATQLGYKSAALESELQQVSSASALALRATGLGMVPNPYPAFINLSDGTVTGVPTPVVGDELRFLTGAMPTPTPSGDAAAVAAAPADPAAEEALPDDLSAAAAPGQGQP